MVRSPRVRFTNWIDAGSAGYASVDFQFPTSVPASSHISTIDSSSGGSISSAICITLLSHDLRLSVGHGVAEFGSDMMS